MGRKRAAPKADAVAGEDKALLKTSGVENACSTHHNANDMKTICGLASMDPKSIVGNGNEVSRRPGRPRRKISPEGRETKPIDENVNLVEMTKSEAPDHQKVGTMLNSERSLEEEAIQDQISPSLAGLSSNELSLAGDAHVVVRKRGRPKSAILPEGAEEEEPNETTKEVTTADHQQVGNMVVGEGNLEEGGTQNQQHMMGPSVCGRNLEQKLDYIRQAVDEIMSKNSELVAGRPNEGPSSDLKYRTLYIDSMKKINSLVEENYELVKKLEFTRGRIASYENTLSHAMAFPKGFMLVPIMEKDSKDQSQKLTSVPDDQNAEV